MDLLNMLHIGLVTAFQPLNILYCFVGVFIGTLIGVLPGIGPSGAIAILIAHNFQHSLSFGHHHVVGNLLWGYVRRVHHLDSG